MAPVLTINDKRLVTAMQTLGDPTRFAIFQLMLQDCSLCVSDIASRLDISVAAVSQHFKTFEQAGLVDKERNGHKICYRVDEDNQLVKRLMHVMEG